MATRSFWVALWLTAMVLVAPAFGASCESFLVEADAITQPARYALGAGAKIRLRMGPEAAPVEAVFLGRLVTIDGASDEAAFYEHAAQLIHLIPFEKLTVTRAGSGETVANAELEPVVKSINQEGGTCAAFSLFNCLRQLQLRRYDGNGHLNTQLSTEAGRAGLLVRVVNKLYIENQGSFALMNELAGVYGYKVYQVPTTKASEFSNEVVKVLKAGWPTLLKFDVPGEMSETPYTIMSRRDERAYERRLWLPKSRWQFRKSSHLVLALGVFEAGGALKILVSDPNWQAPRLWDLAELEKMGPASMEAYVLWQEAAKEPPAK